MKTARKAIRKSFRGKKVHVIVPRIIHVPKIGGFLPYIPIITALGTLGAVLSDLAIVFFGDVNSRFATGDILGDFLSAWR